MYLTASTLIKNCSVYDFHSLKKQSFIHFNERILQVDTMEHYDIYCSELEEKGFDLSKIHWIEGDSLLVLPGLVAGHTHIYSTFARGLSLPFSPESFQDILEQLWWKIDKELNLTEVYYSGLSAGIDYLKSGVTTVIDHHASGDIRGSLRQLEKALCEHLGLRAGLCFETSDRYIVEECIAENKEFIETHQDNPSVFGLFGLHASMSLSDETLLAVKKMFKRGLFIFMLQKATKIKSIVLNTIK
jgi:cytosine/adenosine deaminase-related metal-dependent hydrolase